MRILIVILALIAAVATTLVSSRPHLDQMETRLSRSVAIALTEDERFGHVEVQFDYLKGTLSGTAPSEEAKADAEKTARRNRLAGRIVNEIQVLKRDQESTLLVNFEKGEVSLRGRLPSEEIRNALVEAASSVGHFSSDLFVSDRVKFADWQEELVVSLPSLLENASSLFLEITAAGVVAEGGIRGEAAKTAFIQQARLLQPGAIFTENLEVLPDLPAQLMVSLDGNTAKVGGWLPNESLKNEIAQQFEKTGYAPDFENLNISNRVITPTWNSKLAAFLPVFTSSGVSSFELADAKLTLIGKIKGDDAKEHLLLSAKQVTSDIVDQVAFVPDRPAMIFATLAEGVLTIEGQLPLPKSDELVIESSPRLQNEVERNARVIPQAWNDDAFPFIEKFFEGAKSGAISIREGNLLLSREIKGEAARDALVSAAKARFPTLKLDNQITLQPDRPAQLLVKLENRKLTISGQIDDPGLKEQLLGLVSESTIDEVLANDLQVNNRVISPPWSNSVPGFLATAIANVDSAEIELSPDDLRLKRSVIGKTGNATLLSAANQFWPTAKIKNQLTIQPDQPVSLQATLTNGKLIFKGQVHDQTTKEMLLKAVSEIEPLPVLTADMGVDPMIVSPPWMAQVPGFLTSFFEDTQQAGLNLQNGNLELVREGLSSEQKGQFALEGSSFLSKTGKLIDKMKLAPDQPSILTAVLQDGKFRLVGTVPTESLKAKLEAAAKSAGGEVSSTIQVSSEVAPPRWEKSLPGFLTDFFKDAKNAELEINGKGLRLKRQVPDNTIRGQLLARANLMLPEGAGLTNQIVLPPDKPASLQVLRDGDSIRFKGWIPDDSIKTKIANTASKLDIKPENIDISLRTSSRIIPPAWVDELEGLIVAAFQKTKDAELTIDEEGITIRREVSSPEDKEIILANAKSILPKDGKLGDEITVVIPKIAKLKILLAEGTIQLEGLVPSEDISNAIESAVATLGDFEVTSEIAVDTELEVAGWEKNAAPFIASFFEETEAANVELTPNMLILRREVPSEQIKADFLNQAKALLPKDAKLIDQIKVQASASTVPMTPNPDMEESELQMPKPIVAKPIVVKPMATTTTDGIASAALVVILADNVVQLSGALPDTWSRDAILKGAHQSGKAKDNLLILENLPKIKWPPAIGKFLPVFTQKASEARLEVTGKTVLLFGKTRNSTTKEVLLATLTATLPDGFEVRDHLRVEEDVTIAFSESIPFRSGSTWVSPEAKVQIESVATRALEDKEAHRILIKGFANSSDDPQSNTSVSELRAYEVRDILIDLGLDAHSLEAVGAGDGEGNHEGRRVEITVAKKK
tara:strand:- start:4448 stop:8410 length:3963 start_codon:yes stop_codon:yes gene_type:complete